MCTWFLLLIISKIRKYKKKTLELCCNLKHMFYHFAPTKHPFKVIINKRKVIHLQVTTDNKVHLRFA